MSENERLGPNDRKRRVEFASIVLLPIIGLAFILAEHCGLVDRMLGLDLVEEVANRFDKSYSPHASMPVYPEDAEWRPTIRLIEKYSAVKWPPGRQPQTIARMQAKLSEQDGGGYEWTSPATPVAVLYRRWPATTGQEIPKEDWAIVGSIGELHGWVQRSKNSIHFLFSDCFITAMAAILGFWLWRLNGMQEHWRKATSKAETHV
jgi:hypothetical protein